MCKIFQQLQPINYSWLSQHHKWRTATQVGYDKKRIYLLRNQNANVH